MLFTELFDKYLSKGGNNLPEYFFLKSKINELNLGEKVSNSNYSDPSKISEEKIRIIRSILHELDYYFIIEELSKMKIYYQINHDPRRPENKSLYAKALCPKLGKVDKKKHIGINFGSLKKNPEGWTTGNKQKAKLELLSKAFLMIAGQ